MTVCGKGGKTIKLFSHPSHKPWKSLRDSHIPSALRLIISIQFSNQKRSLPQLPIPLTFRLILQLEKTEREKIFVVTRRVHYQPICRIRSRALQRQMEHRCVSGALEFRIRVVIAVPLASRSARAVRRTAAAGHQLKW